MATKLDTRHDNRRLILNKSCVARKLNIGPWTRLRIGLQANITGAADAVIADNPHLSIGLCSSEKDYIYPEDGCHFAGFQTCNEHAWTIDEKLILNFNSATLTDWRLVKKEGATETYGYGSTSGAFTNFPGGHTPPNTSAMIGIEYEKTSGTIWTLRPFCWLSGASEGAYFSTEFFLATMDVPYGGMYAGAWEHDYVRDPEIMTVDESTNGVLDMLNIAWDQTGFDVELLHVFVSKLRTS